ncbi:MAG: sulfur relay protein DsrC [Candidatus Parabeggiatoa sp. nov. 3]|jgi:hypothetical protein|nr:MAG: sulfur relay protein DsrC [Gammaproteobacteria bacterium]RKZ63008.1 MAG: sulfur relay protein DsrC [Gammaproteobacteria bacterium]RKZ75310.1 MAG: sulfur relay protein DsrC [Gammaproteobacteria bacterium]HEW98361.1 sulfur relay protein DsrC [Beggiatoa sp.]
MLHLSEILIKHHELQNFEELVELVKQEAQEKRERFFRMDVRPNFSDTPENWEDRLEAAFY